MILDWTLYLDDNESLIYHSDITKYMSVSKAIALTEHRQNIKIGKNNNKYVPDWSKDGCSGSLFGIWGSAGTATGGGGICSISSEISGSWIFPAVSAVSVSAESK